MAHKLVVTIPFADYQKGDVIDETADVKAYQASHGRHVVRVADDGEPAAEPAKAMPKPAAKKPTPKAAPKPTPEPAAPVLATIVSSDPT